MLKTKVHPPIHCSMGSASVGVQCPLPSSLVEFPGYQDWFWYPGLSPVLVSIAFPFAFHISVLFRSLCFTCHWSSFVLLLYDCRICTHPSTFHLLTFVRWVSRLGTGSGTRYCGPRGGAGVPMKQGRPSPLRLWCIFPPVSDFPSNFRKFLDFLENFKNFLKISHFHPPKFLTTFF